MKRVLLLKRLSENEVREETAASYVSSRYAHVKHETQARLNRRQGASKRQIVKLNMYKLARNYVLFSLLIFYTFSVCFDSVCESCLLRHAIKSKSFSVC